MNLQDLYGQYSDRVQFLMVYIREAHPTDGWWLGGGLPGWLVRHYAPETATHLSDPATMETRRAAAAECEAALRYGIRTLVDGLDDAVSRAYAARPTRLYLIGLDGRVVYASGPGPVGFRPADLRDAIEAFLSTLPLST